VLRFAVSAEISASKRPAAPSAWTADTQVPLTLTEPPGDSPAAVFGASMTSREPVSITIPVSVMRPLYMM
jgi:hypothetical protein